MITINTNFGAITLELTPEQTPITVNNFLTYVKSGFYNGVIFHRVIKDFMIQGGGFGVNMVNKETNATITNEADLGLGNLAGTIAMARTSAPHSASAQFFINLKDNNFLNFKSKDSHGYGYCVFGRVVSGMDVVQKIAQVKTHSIHGHQDVPVMDVVIESIIENSTITN